MPGDNVVISMLGDADGNAAGGFAVIDSKTNPNAENRVGLHHMGFLVESLEEGAARVEQNGGHYHSQIKGVGDGPQSERKYRDPNGIDFDIVNADQGGAGDLLLDPQCG